MIRMTRTTRMKITHIIATAFDDAAHEEVSDEDSAQLSDGNFTAARCRS